MSELAIRQIFELRLDAWAKERGICVAFENKPFKPPEGVYLRATLRFAPAIAADITGTETQFVGVFLIDIMGLPSKGSKESGVIAEELRALFPTFEVTKGQQVSITQMSPLSVGSPQQDGTRYQVPTSFQFTALT